MIPRSCVIRVLPAAAVSPVPILPIRVDPGWRGGAGGAGWDGWRGAEPLGYVYGRGGGLGGLGWAGAGSGMTCSPFTGRGGRRVAGRRCDGGRDAHTGVNARRYPTPIRAGVSCWRARPGAAAITAAWLAVTCPVPARGIA